MVNKSSMSWVSIQSYFCQTLFFEGDWQFAVGSLLFAVNQSLKQLDTYRKVPEYCENQSSSNN